MRIIVQRTKQASVTVASEVVGHISHGLLLLVGVKVTDTMEDVQYLADKVAHLRIFEDETGKMNDDVRSAGGQILSVSQFTLYGDVRKGRRPNYMDAARPEDAVLLYDAFNQQLREYGIQVETGRFAAMMEVRLVNDGPVTILLDSEKTF